MARKFTNVRGDLRALDHRNSEGMEVIRKLRLINNGHQGRIAKRNVKRTTRHGWELDPEMADPSMGRGSGSAHYTRGGHHSRGPRAGQHQFTNRAYWYQITVVNGSRYARTDVLSKLAQYLEPRKYFPICYQIVRSDAVFYVERFHMAQMVLSCTRKIQMDDGQFLMFRMKDSRPPLMPIDDVMIARMKTAMSGRFVTENKALDLSAFVRDPEFIDGLFCNLNRAPILAAVLKIINENIPDLHALNLSTNGIRGFENNTQDLKKLKSLRVLYLSENNITNLNYLNNLKEMEISELTLERNPVLQNFSDKTHYVRIFVLTANQFCLLSIQNADKVDRKYPTIYEDYRVFPITPELPYLVWKKNTEFLHRNFHICYNLCEVRKRFPKLTKLDNTDLMPLVTFDVGDEAVLPAPNAAFICVPEGRTFVKEFLSQYFQIYDSDDRTNLAQAYAENALFSLTSTYPAITPVDSPRLNVYHNSGRNLLRISDFPRRKVRLQVGKTAIVEFLHKQLPKTEHDLISFAVDLPIFNPQLISLCVTGVFRERGVGSATIWPMRYFSRAFLIVPMGSGFCIVNETLFVTNVTEEQAEMAFKVEANKPVPTSPAIASPSAPPVLNDNVKMQMVQTVSEQTGMNLDWSKKCLEETEWDFNRAVFTFGELQKRGAIPAEAFIK